MTARLEELAVCDLWAAEAYITALEASEVTLMKMLDQGIKIHSWLLAQMTAQFPDALKESGFSYKGAKQFVHGMNYDAGEKKLFEVSSLNTATGLPLPRHICAWTYEFYHSTFPGIKRRHRKIQHELQTTRSVTSLLGRKRIFFQSYGQELLNQAYAWPSQSCIGELTNIALVRLNHWGKLAGRAGGTFTYPCLNTHDGLAIRCYCGEREQVTEQIKKAFNIPLRYQGITLLVPVEVKFGPNFNDLSDKRLLRYTT